MLAPADRLRYLLAPDAFAICPMLTAADFVSFCKDRGIATSEDQLERFEKLGILYPIARIKWPWVTHKIETIDEGRQYRDHGILQPEESWSGETREEWGRWSRRDVAADIELFDGGHLWDPRSVSFLPWATHEDDHGTHTETYYSRFQTFPLEWKQMFLDCHVDTSIFSDGADPETVAHELAKSSDDRVGALRNATMQDDVAFVAQALATRYYPLTQTDRRTFTLQGSRFDWNWNDYVMEWDAAKFATELGITGSELSDRQQTVAMLAKSRDPLQRWYQLVRFIAVDKKDHLTGKAQYAQLLYSIEYMFRIFCKDAWNIELHPPDEGRTWKNEDLYGKGIPNDPLRHLEYVVNGYNLNPRPKLILVVEGASEKEAIPYIAAQALGHEFSPLGIEVRTLGGVGEYTGTKRYDRYGALEKFIDEYHYRQTPVVILLDREGRVITVTSKLLQARSKLYPQRMLTKAEYVRVWTRNIEFDNFTNSEIAAALTKLADGHGIFSEEDVAEAERAYDRKAADPLGDLYRRKTGRDLNKIDCLRRLADLLIEAVREIGFESQTKVRPLLAILDDVIDLAALNHQPITHSTWKRNQESGYFGAALDVEV